MNVSQPSTFMVPVVEGDGEVEAVPVLLRRIRAWLTPDCAIEVGRPIRVRRDRFIQKNEEFRRMMLLAARKAGGSGFIMVLLDADDDCPVTLAADLVQRAGALLPRHSVSVVCANREFEAWFLASAASLDGRRGLSLKAADLPANPDAVRGAKEWLSRRVVNGKYHEVTDQPAFAAVMDLEAARRNSRSFRKMCTDWSRLVATASSANS